MRTLMVSTVVLALAAPAWAATPLPPADALTATRTTYYHSDHAGNVRAESDRQGTLTATHRYEPFGLTLPEETLSTASPRFGGKLRDPISNLDDFGARDFGAQYGRFLSVDPINFASKALANPQDLNLYSYGLNNPLKYGDPTGRAVEVVGWGANERGGYTYTITLPYAFNSSTDIGDAIARVVISKGAEANDWLNEKILTPLGPYNPELEFSMAVVGAAALGGKIGEAAAAVAAAIASFKLGPSPIPGAAAGCLATAEMKAVLPALGWVKDPIAFEVLGEYVAQGTVTLTADPLVNGAAFEAAIGNTMSDFRSLRETSEVLIKQEEWLASRLQNPMTTEEDAAKVTAKLAKCRGSLAPYYQARAAAYRAGDAQWYLVQWQGRRNEMVTRGLATEAEHFLDAQRRRGRSK